MHCDAIIPNGTAEDILLNPTIACIVGSAVAQLILAHEVSAINWCFRLLTLLNSFMDAVLSYGELRLVSRDVLEIWPETPILPKPLFSWRRLPM